MNLWHKILCRLGWHDITDLGISHGWRHQVCYRCRTDLCTPTGGAR